MGHDVRFMWSFMPGYRCGGLVEVFGLQCRPSSIPYEVLFVERGLDVFNELRCLGEAEVRPLPRQHSFPRTFCPEGSTLRYATSRLTSRY